MWANAKCLCATLASAFWLIVVASSAQALPQDAALQLAENHLNQMTTFTADFTQIDPQGGTATGKVYIKRPGQMRWEYAPPTPILMVANEGTLVYHDTELDQISYVPLEESLATFITRPNINFSDPAIQIVDVREGAKALRMTILQKDKPEEGSLGLVFETNPMQLRQMVMIDGSGQITSVSFENIRFGIPLDKELFRFKDPRALGRKRRG